MEKEAKINITPELYRQFKEMLLGSMDDVDYLIGILENQIDWKNKYNQLYLRKLWNFINGYNQRMNAKKQIKISYEFERWDMIDDLTIRLNIKKALYYINSSEFYTNQGIR